MVKNSCLRSILPWQMWQSLHNDSNPLWAKLVDDLHSFDALRHEDKGWVITLVWKPHRCGSRVLHCTPSWGKENKYNLLVWEQRDWRLLQCCCVGTQVEGQSGLPFSSAVWKESSTFLKSFCCQCNSGLSFIHCSVFPCSPSVFNLARC